MKLKLLVEVEVDGVFDVWSLKVDIPFFPPDGMLIRIGETVSDDAIGFEFRVDSNLLIWDASQGCLEFFLGDEFSHPRRLKLLGFEPEFGT